MCQDLAWLLAVFHSEICSVLISIISIDSIAGQVVCAFVVVLAAVVAVVTLAVVIAAADIIMITDTVGVVAGVDIAVFVEVGDSIACAVVMSIFQ